MLVCGKINRNSIFLGRKSYIPDWLYIMMVYISFYRFFSSNFGSKSKVLGFGLTKNMTVCGKNWSKVCISWSYNPYFGSVIHNVCLPKFFQIFKFWLKIQRCALVLTENMLVCRKNWPKLCISWPWSSYFKSVIHNYCLHKFLHIF
jgi:hypothetical protein